MSAVGQVIIYALSDPRKPTAIRYVGKTRYRLKHRLSQHINGVDRYRSYRSAWIKSIMRVGVRPIIWPIEICHDENWGERERHWIEFLKPLGLLTNLDNGGGGSHYQSTTEETKRKQSIAKKGKPWTKAQWEGRERTKHYPRTEKQMQQFRNMLATRKLPPMTKERLDAMIAASKMKPRTEKQLRQILECSKKRSIRVMCLDTGEVFNSLSEAARSVGVGLASKISAAIARNGKCKKKKWKYV